MISILIFAVVTLGVWIVFILKDILIELRYANRLADRIFKENKKNEL